MNHTAALFPIIVVFLAFDIFCLVDLARVERVRYLPKWAWVLVILFVSSFVGGVIYLILGKER